MGEHKDTAGSAPASTPQTSATPAASAVPPPFRATSEETLIDEVVTEYLAQIADQPDTEIREIRDELLSRINAAFEIENIQRRDAKSSAAKIVKAKALDEYTIARIMLARRHIAAISLAEGTGGEEMSMLAVYQESGPAQGLWSTAEAQLVILASQIRPSLTANAIESLLKRLKSHAPIVSRTTAAHLIAVNNGVFDHQHQQLLDFSPEYVFLTKSPVDYDPQATSPVITHPRDGSVWDVDSWIEELSDDEGVPQLLWEIISAALRPGVRWNKAAFFHSSRGNNGKGTLCSLLRNLLGPNGSASIPIANFGKPFALTELVHARAIITDENSVGAFARDLGDFKSVVTGDAFTLDRKYKDPVSVQFSGLVVQCVNDFPKSRDKSSSYTRRQLFVPFRKWFGDVERSYIKTDYLAREDVLRYVLRVALQMQHEEFSQPQACLELLAQFQRENNPVRDFWSEFEEEFVWDLLPTAFLYDLFVAWFRKTHPSGTPINRNDFSSQLAEVLIGDGRWAYPDPQKKHRPGQKMSAPEPLVAKYDLRDWMNSQYQGRDPDKLCIPHPLRVNYVGVARIQTQPQVTHAGSSSSSTGEADDTDETQSRGDSA